MAKIR
jgi:toxin ParE1/3/4